MEVPKVMRSAPERAAPTKTAKGSGAGAADGEPGGVEAVAVGGDDAVD